MSLINTEIKPFTATAFHNGAFVDVSDADLKGKWSVVFFYPADFTFVCPTELGDLADNYAEFQRLGVEIYCVSTDTHFTHKAWHDTSDTIGKIRVPDGRRPDRRRSPATSTCCVDGQGLADRGTFVIDPDGVDPARRDHRRGHRPQRRRAAPQGQGRAVRRGPPERGVPGQVGRGRRHPRPVARPRRQDLIRRAVRAGHRPAPRPISARRSPAPPRPLLPRFRPLGLLENRHARRRPRRAAEDPPREDHPPRRARRLARRQPQVAPSSRSCSTRSPRCPTASPSSARDDDDRRPSFAIGRVGTDVVGPLRRHPARPRVHVAGARPPAGRRPPVDRLARDRSSRSRTSRATTPSRPTSRSPARTAPTSCRRSTS